MRRFEELSFMELVDMLAESTEKYTKILKDNRNSDEQKSLRKDIRELIAEIEFRRNGNQTPSSNPALPGYQFLLIKEV
jgi:hypothetical protein